MNTLKVVLFKELKEILRDPKSLVPILLFALSVPVTYLVFALVVNSGALHVAVSGSSTRVIPSATPGPVRVAVMGPVPADLLKMLKDDNVQVLTTDSPREQVRAGAVDAGLAFGNPSQPSMQQTLVVYWGQSRPLSLVARSRIEADVRTYNQSAAETALKSLNADPALLRRIAPTEEAIESAQPPSGGSARAASGGLLSGSLPRVNIALLLLSTLLPFVLVVSAYLAGFYTGIDVTAGERERHTLEALFLVPADRGWMLLAKTLAVATCSYLCCLVIVIGTWLAVALVPVRAGGSPAVLGPGSLVVMLIVSALLSLLFSALHIAVGVLARSFKQGSAYTTVPLLVALLLTVPALIPGVQPGAAAYLLPVYNAVAVIRDAVLGNVDPAPLLITCVDLLALAAICWLLARWIFSLESILVKV
jgi:sodium transport system permease protein